MGDRYFCKCAECGCRFEDDNKRAVVCSACETCADLGRSLASVTAERDEAIRVKGELAWLIENSGRCSFCGKTMLQEESAAHMLACEKHPIAAVTKERDGLREALRQTAARLEEVAPKSRLGDGRAPRSAQTQFVLQNARAALSGEVSDVG